MAGVPIRLEAAVGIRFGRSPMPNTQRDLDKVIDLFDRIPVLNGGSMEIAGVWATDRNAIVAEVTAQIVVFQTANRRPVIDGVIDPGGGTLKRMNELARELGRVPLMSTATIAPAPNGLAEDIESGIIVAEPISVRGASQMKPLTVKTNYTRKLVRYEGSSITWFGVVVPVVPLGGQFATHLNFTPSPAQGHYYDSGYDTFTSWAQLWDDYTTVIGGQVAAATSNQILVLPFYRNSQVKDLGQFLVDWKFVVESVVTAVFNDLDPTALRDTYVCRELVTSSFSNGWVAHNNFQGKAQGVSGLTKAIYDLDGVAGGSHWVPPKSTVYRNQAIPRGANPQGNIYYVGGRWNTFAPFYGGHLNTHACCRNHLLYHALKQP